MKKILVIAGLFVAFSVFGQQKSQKMDRMSQENFMTLFNGIDLNAQQQKDLEGLYAEMKTHREEKIQKKDANWSQKNQEDVARGYKKNWKKTNPEKPYKSGMHKNDQRIQEILTPAQFEKFSQNRKEMMQDRMQRKQLKTK